MVPSSPIRHGATVS